MYEHVLVPTDGSDLSIGAVHHAAAFAKQAGSRITLLTVLPPYNPVELGAMWPLSDPEEHNVRAGREADRRLAAAKEVVEAEGVPCETVYSQHPRPYEAIIETARSRGCDLILMASHGWRGLAGVLLGSETTKVLTHSSLPVLVVR